MALHHASRETDEEEAVPASQCRFCAVRPLDRLRSVLPAPFANSAASNPRPVPTTTLERRQASVRAASLDQDGHLAEKVAAVINPAEEMASDQTVFYLAYGSNLGTKTFRQRRGIEPLSQISVFVPDLRLTFDLPWLPYVEPCFATTQFRNSYSEGAEGIELEDDVTDSDEDCLSEKASLLMAETRGTRGADYHKRRWHKPLIAVVYEVTLADYAKIIASEGGGRGYSDVVVDCYPFPESYQPTDPVPDHPNTPPFKAHTLISPATRNAGQLGLPTKGFLAHTIPSQATNNMHLRPDPDYAQPSARYLNLISTGAAEHNLPLSYREYLAQIRPYRVTTRGQRVGRALSIAVWAPLLIVILVLSKMFAGPDGRSPQWLVVLGDFLLIAVWKLYDLFFVKVFGDGERTIYDTPAR
ncbi:hypothetical protein NUU61_001079 [Penicillium alfredii]|uniref:gamma-glutamylcyclotransferase n=1 Tax=Penicillium alfredii TaxID=1506179 RepID=A0A9W9KRA6_9EURO|nr:uncharacterized protein NUU61_001079 [Penicillium alfredii]KAJ5115320.1 hypothetical protein NUU61_001079 [Penicillium alfredii]